jgi:hypothetical protein
MYDTLDNLWLAIDAELTQENRADMLSVLADFYEDHGDLHAERLLRMLVISKTSKLTVQLTNLCEFSSAAKLIKRMSASTARLFACTCAEQILLESETELLESIQVARGHLFGLKSDQMLDRAREIAWHQWSNADSREARYRAWIIVRACGAVHRGGNTDEHVFVDALYAWLKVRTRYSEINVRETLGMMPAEKPSPVWNWQAQIQTAAEYLFLGRMIVESPSMKKVREEYREKLRLQNHSRTRI